MVSPVSSWLRVEALGAIGLCWRSRADTTKQPSLSAPASTSYAKRGQLLSRVERPGVGAASGICASEGAKSLKGELFGETS